MITDAPLSPGTALPMYQPAVMPLSAGGTSTVWSLFRPSCIRGLSTPMDAMVTRAGEAARSPFPAGPASVDGALVLPSDVTGADVGGDDGFDDVRCEQAVRAVSKARSRAASGDISTGRTPARRGRMRVMGEPPGRAGP